ncbi:cilia- and flagella-associated protein 58-like [Neodiprion lecontei]|uniref:Cilia- and flagella-associated protein 58-like n=1 Tax=Neodiprion lecontei TaxID=441921 RepID=A0A6J0C0H4_NEOLC|nr:cilia- and flagella-associated protein 58-like [Neodiprion lecontei]
MMEMEISSEVGKDGGSEDGERSSSRSSAGSTFCALEEDYAKILKEMKKNSALAAFETEYTRLFDSLYTTHRNEKRLENECEDLQEEIDECRTQLTVAEKQAELYRTKIEELKEDIENALKLADAAHDREQAAQEKIASLRLTAKKLSDELDQKNRQLGMEEKGTAISKQKEGLLKEREKMLVEIDGLRQRIANAVTVNEELERKNSLVDHKMLELQDTIETQTNDFSKERTARERAEQTILDLQEELRLKNVDLQNATNTLKNCTANVAKLESTVKEQKLAAEKLQKQIEQFMVKRLNAQAEIDNLNTQLDEMSKENIERNKKIKAVEMENNRLVSELEKLKSQREGAGKKLFKAESAKTKLEAELHKAKSVIQSMEADMDRLIKKSESDKRALEVMRREKDLKNKALTTARSNLKKQGLLLKVQEQAKIKLESEVSECMTNNQALKKTEQYLEKERDKYIVEVQELAQKVEDQIDLVKMKQMEIFDYKKRLAEAETKFRQQQNLFEAVRADRNTCSKALIEAQDEVLDLKQKLKIMSNQIEQLKEEVSTKESNLIKEEFLLGKAEKEKDALKVELQTAHKDISALRHENEERKLEEKRLRRTLQTAENDLVRNKKEIEMIMNERDILGTQLVRRNDELSLQYSRLKIFQSTIRRGDAQYAQRLEDIRLLKLEVKKLRTEKALLSKSLMNVSDLRQEIFHLDRDLTREKLKVMALEEEVQNPLNIHRWRKLEGSDPETYELLSKIQILQKRVLKMCAAMIQKEKKIKEGEKLYMNLRAVLSKQPGPEVIITLQKTQKALRERGKKMKCLIAELNMSESQVNEYKFDLERMNKEMCSLKNKFYLQKKKEQRTNEAKIIDLSEPIFPPVPVYHKKFCGGGFNMTVPTPRNCYAIESADFNK